MKEENFEIIENLDCEDSNRNLLYDYWEFSDITKRKFTHTVKDLLIKHNFRTTDRLEKILKKSGYLTCRKILDCGKCNKIFKIHLRNKINFDRWFHTGGKLNCQECKNEIIKTEISEVLFNFENILSTFQEAKIQEPTQPLTYLEKIFLYVLLVNEGKYYSGVVENSTWNSFKDVEANGVEYILKKIIDKGYIYQIQECIEGVNAQNKLRTFNWFHSELIDIASKDVVQTYLKIDFHRKFKVSIPQIYKTVEEWIEKLFLEIKNSCVNISDLKEIEKFVLDNRLKEVYALIELICEKRNIPIKKNNAFEHNLVRMIKKYDLQHIYSLLLYQANMTASKLYDLSNSSVSNANFIKENIYANKIASYLDKLEKNNEKPKYARLLPENWTYSEVELFISAHIIGNYEKWEKYTSNEILALWSDSIEIDMNNYEQKASHN
ncbi:hypothetical protein [Acinetobacter sp. ANC 3832]|uniref:hypothetical protein n=1 Tax=Acinetobacter sp. ANC 3832 TaxID=1977874 RepID=UPI001D17AA26|nr:hypothetical protein [Acinetobacter sp. ANC 3832]